MKDFLHHLFLPRESNNHRPKLLHHQSLLFFVIAFFIAQVLFSVVKERYSQVLSNVTNISPSVLLSLTNNQRTINGLATLTLNEKLSSAAFLKGTNMLENNYWAHNAPDGTTPWVFIKDVGYEYSYAGENLARGFSTSDEVVNAWMASPGHRKNVLSADYKDIGFAVLEGKLLNEQTTLVVEMFGSTKQPVLGEQSKVQEIVPNTMPVKIALNPQSQLQSVNIAPVFDSLTLAKYISITIVALFIFIFILDMIIIERKKIVRLVGHNLDHIIFLCMVLLFVIMLGRGIII